MELTCTKSLCMKRLTIKKYCCDQTIYYGPGLFANPAFGFLYSGEGELRSFGSLLKVPEMSLFYIPEGARCGSVWHAAGEKPIEFCLIHIINNYPETAESYALQTIPALSGVATGERIELIFSLLSSDERADKVRGIGEYYSFFADALPCLKKAPARKQSGVLSDAIDYIESRFSEDFSVAELAAACNISPSRLSHLFSSELGTTPVKLRTSIRIEKAAELLRSTDKSVALIGQECGWASPIYFSKVFGSVVGVTPGEYRAASAKGR